MHGKNPHPHKQTNNNKTTRGFLMDGEYIQQWSSPPTYQAPKKHQSVMLKPPHTALQAQNHPGRRKKRRVTSSLPLRRTKRKMDPALAGQPSVHVNIWEPWSTNMAPLIQSAHKAAKIHTQRSKGNAAAAMQYRPKEGELPVIAPELTSELLHCLSTLPDPWPLAKITIDMEKPSQWVSKMWRLYFADEYVRRTVGVPTTAQVPDMEPALKAVQNILPKLEARITEFLSEWLVTFLMPAKHVLDTRAPHLYFMFLKEYWFRELYLGLKVTASFDRSESYTRIIDGQVRCITPDFKPKDLQVAWNVQFITVFVPAWMLPPIYHSLRRESIKNTNSASAIGVKSVRPTWFEDIVTTKEPTSHAEQEQHEPMHGLKLVVKEEALPLREQPEFPALAELAKRGLLAPDTWNCKRAQISLKASIDVPMLGTIIEQNGDGLLEQSHMPVGWPLHIDGAVRQSCAHRDTTLQELDDLLGEYDLKRDLVEINRKAPQWSHNAVWNKRYMEPKPGFALQQLWADSESAITQKTSPSYEVKDNDIRRAVMAITAMPAATLPESAFILALGTPALRTVPPQTGSLAQRAIEEWERNLCENKAVAILEQMQAGRPALIKKDGEEMLIAIVLDRPLAEAKALVEAPDAFIQAITRIMQDKQNHPVIAQMIRPGVSDDPPPAESTASSSGGYSHRRSTHPSAAANSLPISATGNVRFSRLPLTENRHWCYIDLRHRCYRSTWGTHGWPVHPWPSRGGDELQCT